MYFRKLSFIFFLIFFLFFHTVFPQFFVSDGSTECPVVTTCEDCLFVKADPTNDRICAWCRTNQTCIPHVMACPLGDTKDERVDDENPSCQIVTEEKVMLIVVIAICVATITLCGGAYYYYSQSKAAATAKEELRVQQEEEAQLARKRKKAYEKTFASAPPGNNSGKQQSAEKAKDKDKKIKTLTEMGFSPSACRSALEKYDWNTERAGAYLVSHVDNSENKSGKSSHKKGEHKHKKESHHQKKESHKHKKESHKKKEKYKVLAKGGLRVRAKPNASAKKSGKLPYDTVITVTKKHGNWVQHSKGWSMMSDGKSGGVKYIQRI